MKILIADDDAVSRRLLEGTLVRLGHEVIAVGNGTDAIAALLQPDGPHMAILDWMMPGADGLAVCREVRKNSSSYLYLILLSAHDSRENMVTGLGVRRRRFPHEAAQRRRTLRAPAFGGPRPRVPRDGPARGAGEAARAGHA